MKAFLASMLLVSCVSVSNSVNAVSFEETSRKFLGIPYGTGANIVDKDLVAPSYDCMTFVETVMALHLATRDEPADRLLNRIRYFDGRRDDAFRKHFVETDWISDNQKLGLVKDVTKEILPQAPSISATIDKSAWFAKVHPELAPTFEASALPKKIKSTIDYIPLDAVPQIIGRIPDESIIIFIQDDENKLMKFIHTPLIVGHMGFAVKVNGQLILRQADSGAKVVNDMDFAKAMVASKKFFRGITVLEMKKK